MCFRGCPSDIAFSRAACLRDPARLGGHGASCRKTAPAAEILLYDNAILHSLPVTIAKLFWSGRSQAVRLPRAFRMAGGEVRIRRVGNAVVLEPIVSDWNWLDALAPVDDDFLAERTQPTQPRAALDDAFGA